MKSLISYVLLVSLFITQSYADLNKNKIKNINSYEASFTQSIVNSSGKEILYNGNIYIKQPHKIVWKYNVPIEKLVYINNKIVTIIEPDLEQAIISKLEQEINILKLLKDAVKVKDNLYESRLYDRDYFITIVDNQLIQIKYKDEIDNNVTIDFKDIKQNQALPDDIFKFRIPFHFDIIRK